MSNIFDEIISPTVPKRQSLEPDYSKYQSREDTPPPQIQSLNYTPMPLNQALDLDEKLKKSAVKKSLKKTKLNVDEGPDLKGDLSKMGKDIGAQAAGDMTSGLLGGGTTGDTAGAVLTAGISSGFNPAVMGAAAVMGIIGGLEKEKQAKRMGQARGDMELAKGMGQKAKIQGEMSQTISRVLGGSGRKRSINF